MLPRHASAAGRPNQQRPRARKEGTTLKILVGERVERAFVLPINAHNPPTTAVIEKLDAVNSAHKWLSVARVVTRFVCAPNVRNLPELFDAPGDFLFVETLSLDERFDTCDVTLDVEDLRRKIDIVVSAGFDGGWE